MPRSTIPSRALVMVTFVSLLAVLGVSAAAAATAATPGPGRAKPAPKAAVSRVDRPAAARAMWVWDTSNPQAVVTLATSRGIGQLYAAVPPNVGTSPKLAELRRLVTLADAAGLRVDALGGDPGWVDNPSAVVRTWLRAGPRHRLVHRRAHRHGAVQHPCLDHEPQGVVKRYLATLDAFQAAAGNTPIEADIPFWFDEIPANRSTFDREVMKRTDAVTVMAYRRKADGVDGSIALSANEVRAGAELGRPVRIGQETNHLGDDPISVKQTFHGQTRSQMEGQLSLVLAAYRQLPVLRRPRHPRRRRLRGHHGLSGSGSERLERDSAARAARSLALG